MDEIRGIHLLELKLGHLDKDTIENGKFGPWCLNRHRMSECVNVFSSYLML